MLIYFGILAGVTAAYVLAAFLWTAYRRRSATAAPSEAPPLPLAVLPVPPLAPAAANFCSQCGRALDADYAFCPGCGHAVRGS